MSSTLLAVIVFIGFVPQRLEAQNCTSLYLTTGADGKVYSINVADGSKTLMTTMTSGKENLAVGPNPLSTGATVFTSSQVASGSTVYSSNISIGTTLPASVSGLTTNPATTGATAGYVYGVSSTRQLIKVSPAPASNLGTITGDANWTGGTIAGDGFFDNTGNLFTIVKNGTSSYLYKIDITALTATLQVQLSGSLPSNFEGIAYLNSKIYAAEVYTTVSLFIFITYNVRLYEINFNTGQGTTGQSVTFSNTSLGNIDLATCEASIPIIGPTCSELFGVVGATHTVYRINETTLGTSTITDGNQSNQGNMAFGPVPSNLNQNQFVTSVNSASGTIYTDVNNTGTLSSTGLTWASPIGLGTDPATGVVWGIQSKAITKWTGSGNATSVGTATGDATWTGGTTLNDIAVDAGGNLYSIIFNGANTYLYRINQTTLVAKLVAQATGTYITDGTTTNGNGLAYIGDYFYYSRINGANTDVWKLDAVTGVSVSVGSVTGLNLGDLGSCATVTNVPADFTFNCGSGSAGLQNGNFLATGGSQTNILRVPITGTVTGLATFAVSGTGITANPTAYQLTLAQGATYVDIPVIYDGSGSSGTRALTVTASSAIVTGSCSITVNVDACPAGTSSPTLSVTSKANTCPATTIDLSTITASNNPGGSVTLTWHTNTPATSANKLSSITALPVGTYYAAFYYATSDCYSGSNGAATTAVSGTISYCCSASSALPLLNKN